MTQPMGPCGPIRLPCYRIRPEGIDKLRVCFWDQASQLPQLSAFVPPGSQRLCVLGARPGGILRLSVQSLSDRSRPDDSCGKIVVSDFRGFSGGV